MIARHLIGLKWLTRADQKYHMQYCDIILQSIKTTVKVIQGRRKIGHASGAPNPYEIIYITSRGAFSFSAQSGWNLD